MSRWSHRLCLVALLQACGTSGSNPTPTAGRPAADGGRGGAGPGAAAQGGAAAEGGKGSSDAGAGPDFELPSCLRDLFAACPLTGACRGETDADSGVGSACYASGATLQTLTEGSCDPGERQIVWTSEVRKPDGSLCYRQISDCECWQACESGTSRWTDASGAQVAEAKLSSQRVEARCAGANPEICSGPGCQAKISSRPANAPDCAADSCKP